MKLSTQVLLLALVALPCAALADRSSPEDQPLYDSGSRPESMIQHSFDELDADHDGRLSTAEASQGTLSDSFWLLDRNDDGYLTRQEHDYRPI